MFYFYSLLHFNTLSKLFSAKLYILKLCCLIFHLLLWIIMLYSKLFNLQL